MVAVNVGQLTTDNRRRKYSDELNNHTGNNMSTPQIPQDRFDETVAFADPHPGSGWVPSPRQIARWAAQIRSERQAEREARENDEVLQ